MSEGPLLPRGTLLLSAPDMLDPNFMHAVVLMIDHREEGAMGIVVNRRAEVRVRDLLPDHGTLGACDEVVWSGGPVGQDSLQILHRLGSGPPDGVGGLPVGPKEHRVSLGADLEVLGEHLEDSPPTLWSAYLRFVVGYAGWGPGQLESEIAERSWLPLAMDAGVVFAEPAGEDAWRLAVSRLGGDGASLGHLPPDTRWN